VVVADAGASGQSAARVVRLQPAPARSLVPQRRPDPALREIDEALIASLQSSINEALACRQRRSEVVTEEAVRRHWPRRPQHACARSAPAAPTLLAEAAAKRRNRRGETEEPVTEIALRRSRRLQRDRRAKPSPR
jgi:hypothetical protein